MASGDSRFTSIFDVLPMHQVKEFVFNRLDLESKKNCRLVCKRWEEGVSEAVYFNLEITDEETVQVIKKMIKPIKDLTLSFLSFTYPKNGYSFTSVQKLILKVTYEKDKEEMCKENLLKLLKECENVQSLEVLGEVVPDDSDVSFLFHLRKIVFSNLRRLKMCCKAEDLFCAQLLRETFSHLTSLYIDFGYTPSKRYESPYIDVHYTQIFEFIGRHGRTLKHINISRRDIDVIEKLRLQVKLCDLDPDAKNSLIDKLKQVQLSTFEYAGTQSDDVYPFCYEMFKAQTKLTKITIKAKQTEFWNLLPQVFKKCSDTLTEFEFEGYRNIEVGNYEIFSCSLLANCSNLEFLRLELDKGVRLTDIQDLPKQLKKLALLFRGMRNIFTASQVEFIASEMYNLEVLVLHYLNLSNGDVFTLLLFKILMKMPRLTTLRIPTDRSVLDEIDRWIEQSGQGCIQTEHSFFGHSYFTVDRLNFNSDLVVL